MKPRQLCDAIHQEIGESVMNQISDGIRQIIRSEDDMKKEINESIQSSRLVNPQRSQGGEVGWSTHKEVKVGNHPPALMQWQFNNGSVAALPNETNGDISDSEPNEPPGFALHNLHQNNNHEGQPQDELSLDKLQDTLSTTDE